jgi:hypothetical protein
MQCSNCMGLGDDMHPLLLPRCIIEDCVYHTSSEFIVVCSYCAESPAGLRIEVIEPLCADCNRDFERVLDD